MRIRNAALIVAVVSAVGLAESIYTLFLYVFRIASQTNFALALWVFGIVIPLIVNAAFFFVLYAESSGRITPELRRVSAIAAAVLTLPAALNVLWQMHATLTIAGDPRVTVPHVIGGFEATLLVGQFIGLVTWLLWVALFWTFRLNASLKTGRALQKLAAILLVFIVGGVGFALYTHFAIPQPAIHFHPFWYPSWLSEAFNALGWAAVPPLLLFLALVWKRWQARLSVHENLLG